MDDDRDETEEMRLAREGLEMACLKIQVSAIAGRVSRESCRKTMMVLGWIDPARFKADGPTSP